MKLNDCFDRFLTDTIEPKDDAKLAKESHKEIRDFLAGDKDYKDRHTDTFLAGSYRRETAVKPIKDVDIIVITTADDTKEKPVDVLNELKAVLDKKYKTKTTPQRRSIRIEREGMMLDVVPTAPRNGDKKPLRIPDREQKEWRWTHPKRHIDRTSELNDAARDSDTDRGRYVPTVKLTKKWKSVQSKDARPKGFFLEVLVGEHHDPDARDWADCFIAFLESFVAEHGDFEDGDDLPTWDDPGLVDEDVDDTSLHTALTSAEFARFVTTAKKSLDTAKRARDSKDVDESVKLWREVFGPDFPAPESDKKESEKTATITVGSSAKRDIRESPPFA